jgi:hypothetical protein
MEAQTVKAGVECDIYSFPGDSSRDLAVVRVEKGYKTPLQKVILGTKTTEIFMSGTGNLTVHSDEGETKIYNFDSKSNNREVIVKLGEMMQWRAVTSLVFYEICEPPYEDGRFQNIDETSV